MNPYLRVKNTLRGRELRQFMDCAEEAGLQRLAAGAPLPDAVRTLLEGKRAEIEARIATRRRGG